MNNIYYRKYIKYKTKYINLCERQIGGSLISMIDSSVLTKNDYQYKVLILQYQHLIIIYKLLYSNIINSRYIILDPNILIKDQKNILDKYIHDNIAILFKKINELTKLLDDKKQFKDEYTTIYETYKYKYMNIYKIFNNMEDIVMNYINKTRDQISDVKDPAEQAKHQEGIKIREISDDNYKKLYNKVKDFNIIKSLQENLQMIYTLLES